MARLCFAHLLLATMVVGVLSASGEDVEFPSFETVLGSKLALADDYYDDDTGTSDDKEDAAAPPPKPCCFPATWQGRAVHDLAVSARPRAHGRGRGKSAPMLSQGVDQFYVDGANKRLAGDKVEFHGHRFSVNFSWIFTVGQNRTGDLYIFDKKEQKCEHRSLHGVVFHQQCLPANASYGGDVSLGPAGSGLRVQSWSFGGRTRRAPTIDGDNHLYPGPGVVFGATAMVVPTSCIPVLLEEHGRVFRGVDDLAGQMDAQEDTSDDHYDNYIRRMMARTSTARPMPPDPDCEKHGKHHGCGFGFSSHAFFSDVYTHIADPSVFTVPSYCKKDADTLRYGGEGDRQLPTILERFIVL